MVETAMELVAILGAALVLLAGLGVLRLPDFYARMHAATKASTIGIGLIGLAGAVTLDEGRFKTLVAVAFIFVTAPVAAHFIGRVVYGSQGIDIYLAPRDDLATRDDPASTD